MNQYFALVTLKLGWQALGMELFEQQFGLAGVERVSTSAGAPAGGTWGMIVPQGTDPCTIDEITPVTGYTVTNYNGKTITSPLYLPFTALTLSSGEADIYRLIRNRAAHGRLQ